MRTVIDSPILIRLDSVSALPRRAAAITKPMGVYLLRVLDPDKEGGMGLLLESSAQSNGLCIGSQGSIRDGSRIGSSTACRCSCWAW